MNHTTNLHLPQWEETDRIHHDDFNDAMAKIDTAVAAAGNCKIAHGTYVGTGTYGIDNPSSLTFPFRPLVIFMGSSNSDKVWVYPATTFNGSTNSNVHYHLTWRDNGISWYVNGTGSGASHQLNTNGATYTYTAFGIAVVLIVIVLAINLVTKALSRHFDVNRKR